MLTYHVKNCEGGWDPVTKELKKDKFEEIDQVFKNVDLVLKDAGGKGWSQVYRVRSFHTDMSHDTLMYVVNKLKEWNPGPKPVFTCVGVTKLGIEGMNLEMEVSAYDDEADTGSKAKPGA